MIRDSLTALFLAASLGACAHAAPPPAALGGGELAYARAGNSADTLAVELKDLATSYCKGRQQVVTVDGRDDVPGDRQIEVTLKFHCHAKGQPAPAAPEQEDDGAPEGVGPWAR